MNSSSETTKGFFKFDKYESGEIEFNESTDMVDVYKSIHDSFHNDLPGNFHVSFYSSQARKILLLNENLLNSKNNPFRFNDRQERIQEKARITFYVEDDSPPDDPSNIQSSMFNSPWILYTFLFVQTLSWMHYRSVILMEL